ncbi:hypothetical protein A3L04_06355 [Thermococcus chitonophagus]|uniref:GINS subunit domain-containing protein n=1 Tax=Thermococcus chitonophagus TaxID=54262 RepID=A0A160VSX6_9EURY|nr:hypothetical protein [Thermococcus chitonophagus]ASJ16719.1 hypothetical protein A3L04_06355 [Thermococcus chitonophagus]CUX78187.1 hypothetical protein CHITON_1408 [Thermococcus chitonophagus]
MTEVLAVVLTDIGSWRKGDYISVDIGTFRELFKKGIVDLAGLHDFVKEVAALRYLEAKNTELQKLDEDFYEKVKLVEEVLLTRARRADAYALDTLRRFQDHVRKLKMTRLEKIFYAALIRPNSLEIENKLTKEEREFYRRWSEELRGFLDGGVVDE